MQIASPKKQAAFAFAALVLIFGAGLFVGTRQKETSAQSVGTTSITLTGSPGTSQPQGVDFSQLWQTWNILQNDFVQSHGSSTPPTDQEKVYGAIEGLVASYGDPYTEFFNPSDAAIFDSAIAGSFEGVGMQIDVDASGNLVVVSPLKGSPAETAGMRSGDKIIAIEGTSTAGMSADDAVKVIRGPKGSTVKVTVSRQGVSAPFVVPIVRNTITIPTIDYKNDAGNGVFEIDLYNFSATSVDDFREALRQFFLSGDTKLILDLRGNPGGYLEAAVEMGSYFLPAGDTIVTEDYRGKQADVAHRSYGYNVFANKKLSMAILVDQGSASAAEILAGALQQHNVAKLIGTRTFGKGSVQEVVDLGGGAQLKVTVARWLTPNGTSISDGGLTPNIQATTTAKDVAAGADPQKSAAIQYLTNQ